MQGHRIGYVRVSSFDQNPERQLEQTQVSKVFTDKASGKDTQRPQLEALLSFVREGDTVVVHSMDRLARNLDDLRRLIDRNLNPQKTKKAPQNGCFFNTPCAPYERKRLLNRMTLIDTGYEWRFFAPFPVKWTQLPLCGSQPHTCCRASRSCIRTSSASR